MNELLSELENWIKIKRPTLYQSLNNGLTDEEIRYWQEKFGFSFPEEFVELYKWRNGQDSSNYEYFFNMNYFDEIEVVYNQWEDGNDNLTEFNDNNNIAWGKYWLRFFSRIDSNGFCIDVKGELEKENSIIEYIHDGENAKAFSSLTSLFSFILKCFQEEVFTYELINGEYKENFDEDKFLNVLKSIEN
ncbi:MAG: SMI1/KNR4 family protein [Cyclobacteriaceae bacterium]|jgi:cell wall assembly regulator SMI1|nr:SMI1/KNR4 family protein [Cyclobacteriaceae bacterium]